MTEPEYNWDEHEAMRKALREGTLYNLEDVPYDVLVYELRSRDSSYRELVRFPLWAGVLLIFLLGMAAGWLVFGR